MYARILIYTLALPLTFAAPVNYSYDAAGRLTRIDYGSAGSINYSYDKSGNLLSRNVAASSATGGVITSVNTAGSPASAGIAQNAWIEIKGTNLVSATTPAAGVIWSSAPEFAQGNMPAQLGGVSATVNGKPAFIYFFCSSATNPSCPADQVNVLTPLDSTTGNVQVVVTSGTMSSAPYSANLNAVVPSFLRFTGGYVAATHANSSLLGPPSLYPGLSTPASPGEAVVVYGSGFGLPSQPPVAGSAMQSGSLSVLPVCKVGNDTAAVGFAGLISPGLFQLNLTIPVTAKTADNSITCTYAGATTPAGDVITVQQ